MRRCSIFQRQASALGREREGVAVEAFDRASCLAGAALEYRESVRVPLQCSLIRRDRARLQHQGRGDLGVLVPELSAQARDGVVEQARRPRIVVVALRQTRDQRAREKALTHGDPRIVLGPPGPVL